MGNNQLRIDVPKTTGQNFTLEVRSGEQYFMVGRNGAGKSALLHHIATSSHGDPNIVRVFAHRQTWMSSNVLNMTPASRKQNEEQIKSEDRYFESQWRDEYAHARIYSPLFDLVAQDNARARAIAKLTCPPRTGPVIMLVMGRRKGERWRRRDIRRSR